MLSSVRYTPHVPNPVRIREASANYEPPFIPIEIYQDGSPIIAVV
jgi:hypothetical protein